MRHQTLPSHHESPRRKCARRRESLSVRTPASLLVAARRMDEDATSVLIEAVGRDSSGYVHVVTDDDESLLFRQAETLEFDDSEKRSLFD